MRHPWLALAICADHPQDGLVADVAQAAGGDDEIGAGELRALAVGEVAGFEVGVNGAVDESAGERVGKRGARELQTLEPGKVPAISPTDELPAQGPPLAA